VELLAPAVVFLAGLLLLQPHWGVAVGFALALAVVVALAVWRPALSKSAPVGIAPPVAGTTGPPDAPPGP
jgi:hypothetical protein